MVDNTFYSILNNNDKKFREYQAIRSSFKEYISKSHSYIRKDGDSNQTNDDFKRNLAALISLRDVSRTLRVFQWLVESKAGRFLLSEKEKEKEKNLFQKAIYLSLFICYASRQTTNKDQYFEAIFERNDNLFGNCQNVIYNSQKKLIESLDYDFSKKMIAKNLYLKENCLLIFVCVYAQIPLFIIGKPGTSKSISVEVIMESLKPPHEINNFAKKLELRTLRESFLQCSPITTTKGIEDVFKIAKSKTKENDLGLVILDEVALAELSPDLPLKALHSQLEESEKEISRINQDNKKIQDIIKENGGVSVVAISNWVLDPSNTNRGILLRRESTTQLGATAQQILCTKSVGMNSMIPEIFASYLTKIYEKIVKEQGKDPKSKSRPYFGLRDFYYFLKMIGYCNIKHGISYNNPRLILNALLRNFNSKPDFIEELIPKFPKKVPLITDRKITTRELIYQNINRRIFQEFGFEDKNDTPNYSRNMMILTDKICNLSFILKEIEQLSTKTDYKLFFGSDFAENKKQSRIIRNLQSIEDSIRNGEIVILFKNEQLYEPLYDLLNQNYSKEGDNIYAKISFGNIVSKIRIDPRFRLIVISDKSRAYNIESPAILNRFEKYLLISEEFIIKNEFIQFYQKQKEIIQNICKFADITEEKLLVSYHPDLLPSLVTKLQQILSEKEQQEKEYYLRVEGVNMWMRICNYESILSIYLKTIKKDTNKNTKEISYLKHIWQRYLSLYHDSLNDLIQKTLIPKQIQCSVVLTSSSISQEIKSEQIQNFKFKEIELSKIENDTQFEKEVKKKLGIEPKIKTNPYKDDENFVLIIRFTPIPIFPETIFHQSKYMIENLIKKGKEQKKDKKEKKDEEIKCKIIFIVHLPSTQQSKTQFHFAFEKNWEYFYIDDILPSEIKFTIISESKDSDLNFLENILDKEWEKLFEPIFNSSILQFINPEKIKDTKPFLEKMKTLKDLIFPKLKFIMQQSSESFNSYLYSQLIKKLETIFAILLKVILWRLMIISMMIGHSKHKNMKNINKMIWWKFHLYESEKFQKQGFIKSLQNLSLYKEPNSPNELIPPTQYMFQNYLWFNMFTFMTFKIKANLSIIPNSKFQSIQRLKFQSSPFTTGFLDIFTIIYRNNMLSTCSCPRMDSFYIKLSLIYTSSFIHFTYTIEYI
ncbi:hypothetical protein M0811_13605 [Anaeramoeba ignava]|uniref:AAA+ ATPase domain-containing protein n=1 Tax=Anaeramoeba ignava TaxID=1746090 RepID=A0A9Q0R4Z6_ANAIG|nr:hypothetical protein M0811_13605 [Anaeramoeba ignava]